MREETPGAERTTGQQQPAVVALSASDLPAFCPNPSMPLWSSHPRVYLDLDGEAEAMCPYCGTRYCLKSGTAVRSGKIDPRDSRQEGAPRPEPGVAQLEASARSLAAIRETPNLAADARGNTTLESMTKWLRGRR